MYRDCFYGQLATKAEPTGCKNLEEIRIKLSRCNENVNGQVQSQKIPNSERRAQLAAGPKDKITHNGETRYEGEAKRPISKTHDNVGRKRSASREFVETKRQKKDDKVSGNRNENPARVQSSNILSNEQQPKANKRQHQSAGSSIRKHARNGEMKWIISETQGACDEASGTKRSTPQDLVEAKKRKNFDDLFDDWYERFKKRIKTTVQR